MSWLNINYNIWNTYYKIWESYNEVEQKNINHTIALNVFNDILISDKWLWKKEDSDTRYNYEFIKDKLENSNEITTNKNPCSSKRSPVFLIEKDKLRGKVQKGLLRIDNKSYDIKAQTQVKKIGNEVWMCL